MAVVANDERLKRAIDEVKADIARRQVEVTAHYARSEAFREAVVQAADELVDDDAALGRRIHELIAEMVAERRASKRQS
jgi:hypothetical protein